MKPFAFSRVAPVAVLLVVAAGASASAPHFYYRQLQSFPGGRTQAAAINDAGTVVGSSGDFVLGFQAFASDLSGVLTDIDSFNCTASDCIAINAAGQVAMHGAWNHGGGNWTTAVLRYTPGVGTQNLGHLSGFNGSPTAINGRGDIVGYWSTLPMGGDNHAFLYTDGGGMQDLGTLGGPDSAANGINDAGQIVGSAYDAAFIQHAVIWGSGGHVDLGPGVAVAINNAGLVVGYITVGSHTRAFYWTAADGTQLVPVPANADSQSIALSESGVILGVWSSNVNDQTGFLYTPGQQRVDLPSLADTVLFQPAALNNLGHVVGRALDPNYNSVAFLYTPELGTVDLATVTSPPLNWWGMQPVSINDADQIVVNADGGMSTARAAILAPAHLGDLNCDGRIDFGDINPFVMALSDPQAYAAAYPLCLIQGGDINGDGQTNFADINPFVALLAGN